MVHHPAFFAVSRRRAGQLSWLHSALTAAVWLAGLVAAPAVAGPATRPMLIGVDTAGDYHQYHTDIEFWSHPPFWRAMDELGVDFVGVHLYPRRNYPRYFTQLDPETPESMLAKILSIDAGMRAHGRLYQLNNDDYIFWDRAEVYPGVDEYDAPGGCHRWDLRPEWFEPLLEANATSGTAFVGWIYDELGHMQITGNMFVNFPPEPYELNSFDAPQLADVHGLSVEAGWDKIVDVCSRLQSDHYRKQAPIYSEQVVCDLFHVFARAGWRIAPKLLKDSFASMTMANALGAALQYADRGVEVWPLLDMHSWLGYPGYNADALRSALTMSYWLGAEAVSVENLDWVEQAHHPEADPGSLIFWDDADNYRVTNLGEAFKAFATEYVPAHPRTIDWRDYRPRVAVVRLPDGDYGMAGQPWFRNRLLGNRDHPSDEISREWLKIWPILTHGAMKPGACSLLNTAVYPETASAETYPEFFQPIDSVACFDHTVTGQVLDSVDCFVVCGHALSAGTFEAIRRRVVEFGATCIIARRLYAPYAGDDNLPGRWLVVDSFEDPRIAEWLAPHLSEPDVARFRFTDRVVEFRRGTLRDSITVRVFDRALVDQYRRALVGLEAPPADSDLNGDGRFDVADLTALVGKFSTRRHLIP
jgi:hypothetical protein